MTKQLAKIKENRKRIRRCCTPEIIAHYRRIAAGEYTVLLERILKTLWGWRKNWNVKQEFETGDIDACIKAVEEALGLRRCTPMWGTCNLKSGHKGKHNAYAKPPKLKPGLSRKRCKKCGFPISSDSTFCGECLCEEDGE